MPAKDFFICQRSHHQNKGNDTKSNSIKQLEVWEYDLDNFIKTYEGKEQSKLIAEIQEMSEKTEQ